MQCLTYVVFMSLSHYHGKRPYPLHHAYCLIPRFPVCTSLAPRTITVVFGLGDVRMCKTLQNGVVRNGQQLGSGVNIFIDHDKFEAMKTLSGCRALHRGKHQFRAKIMVRT